MSAGGYHGLVLSSDGLAFGWGYNMQGQVGDGSTNHRNVPIELPALP